MWFGLFGFHGVCALLLVVHMFFLIIFFYVVFFVYLHLK